MYRLHIVVELFISLRCLWEWEAAARKSLEAQGTANTAAKRPQLNQKWKGRQGPLSEVPDLHTCSLAHTPTHRHARTCGHTHRKHTYIQEHTHMLIYFMHSHISNDS